MGARVLDTASAVEAETQQRWGRTTSACHCTRVNAGFDTLGFLGWGEGFAGVFLIVIYKVVDVVYV